VPDRRRIALAFVGTLVSDEPQFHGPAFNRAGQMFQLQLVRGLAQAGLPPSAIYSVEPVPAFPRARRLLGRARVLTLPYGLRARLVPFVNVHPLKAITAGLATGVFLLRWCWQHRGARRVIHCINLTMPPGLVILAVARLTRSTASVSLLDVWKPGALVPDTLRWRIDFALQRGLIPRFDALVPVSKAVTDELAPGKRVCRIEGGVAPEQFRQCRASRSTDHSRAAFRVVLSGSLEPHNGVELVLGAFARLRGPFELFVAGAGSQTDLVVEASHRDSRVCYRGFLPFAEVLELYRSADLLLNARVTGTLDTRYFFPSKLMELLASGTPVLSTCTGDVEEQYGHVLYLLREETPEALARRIEEIAAIRGDARQAKALEAQAFMFREKSWGRQAARLATYLENVLGGPPHQAT
jgi:glycosyltransferase involved in cell wall biosynthesis